MKVSKFHDVIAKLLGERLKHFNKSDRNLDLVACVEIFQTIFDSLVEVFEESNVKLTNESMNYLAQQYYDGVLINGREELNPNIFTQRAKLEKIDTKECALLAVMLNGTDFAIPILQEIKKRA
jgi:hypothetical protein